MTKKPRVFIASAVESLAVADAINVNLDHQTEATVWKHGFTLSVDAIDDLLRYVKSVDFAIFVFTPDDLMTMRGGQHAITRDNVIYELGLFTAGLGKDRCFIVKPRDENLHLPSDLAGLTPADYNGSRSDHDLISAVNAPCVLIKTRIAELGLIENRKSADNSQIRQPKYDYQMGKVEQKLLSRILEHASIEPSGMDISTLKMEDESTTAISLALVKLERLDYIDKRVEQYWGHSDRSFFAVSITANGIDYLLENQSVIESLAVKTKKPAPAPSNFDDDIPF